MARHSPSSSSTFFLSSRGKSFVAPTIASHPSASSSGQDARLGHRRRHAVDAEVHGNREDTVEDVVEAFDELGGGSYFVDQTA